MANFNWADWAIIAIMAISGLISLRRGFIKEALSLSIWVVAFIVASAFSSNLAFQFEAYAATPESQRMVAFATLFLVTLLLGSLVNYLLSSLVKVAGLSNIDRGLGVIFGVARGGLVVTAIVLYAPLLVNIDQESWWHQSELIPFFLGMEERFYQLTSFLSELMMRFVDTGDPVINTSESVDVL